MAFKRSQTCIDPVELDPEFVQSRREMIVILVVFLGSLIWTMGVSFAAGYPQGTTTNTSEVTLVWGMPSWVFWGILAPWLVIDVLAFWFCFFYMQDHCPQPLHDAQEEAVTEHDQIIKERHER